MSVIDLYSVETKFNDKKKEYISLMDSINYSCLGKDKTSIECVKAARLNAEMQSNLIEMSNLLDKNKFKGQSNKQIDRQQLELLRLSDKLERELDELMTDAALHEDTTVFQEQNKLHALSWGFMAVLVTALVIYQYKKI
jgi:hypothetical protein